MIAPCPAIALDIINADTTAIDPDVFSFDPSTFAFSIQTDDLSKDGLVDLKIQAKYEGIKYTHIATHDFTVDLIDTCKAQAMLSSIIRPVIQK